MPDRREIMRHGRTWSITRIPADQADEEDFRFWFEGMTPDERVLAVYDALESSLKAQGQDGVPRFRRVHRRVQCPWGEIPDRRKANIG